MRLKPGSLDLACVCITSCLQLRVTCSSPTPKVPRHLGKLDYANNCTK